MTEQLPPVPPPYYPQPYGWQPPPRTHAEMTWQDLMACITAFFGVSIVALVLGLVSHAEARKQGLKMHAAGMVGMIFGAIGTAGWLLFWGLFLTATAAATHTSSLPSATTPTVAVSTPVSDVHTQITTWYTSGGQTHVNAITADLTNIASTASANNRAGLLAACQALNTDTANAYQYGPIPDSEAQASWQQGLSYFNRSGSECMAGVSSNNAAMIQQATNDLRAGTPYITAAGTRIRALGN